MLIGSLKEEYLVHLCTQASHCVVPLVLLARLFLLQRVLEIGFCICGPDHVRVVAQPNFDGVVGLLDLLTAGFRACVFGNDLFERRQRIHKNSGGQHVHGFMALFSSAAISKEVHFSVGENQKQRPEIPLRCPLQRLSLVLDIGELHRDSKAILHSKLFLVGFCLLRILD